MATSTSWDVTSLTALSFTPSLSGLSDSTYSLAAEVDNTVGYINGQLQIILPSAVTCGANSPLIGFTALYKTDGTNYPNPPGTSAGATGLPQTCSVPGPVSSSFTSGHSLPFILSPFFVRFLLYNKLGVAFSSGTVTVNLIRWNLANK